MRQFFRVELDATGAILSCAPVEHSERNGKFVRYVEALDAAGACEQVKAWWEARKAADRAFAARRSAARRAAGTCVNCTEPAVAGRVRCAAHARAAVDNNRRCRRRAAGEEVPLMKAPPCETAQQARARRLQTYAQARKRSFAKGGHGREQTYRLALSHFDKLGPKQFRAWLVGKISALEAKRLAKQKDAA